MRTITRLQTGDPPPSPCSSIPCVLGILELPPPRTLVLTEDHRSHEEAHHHPQEPEESL